MPSIFVSRLDSSRDSIQGASPQALKRASALARIAGSNSIVMTLPKPFSFKPSASFTVPWPRNVPVSTTSFGLRVVTSVFRKSRTSTSVVCESSILHNSGCGHSGVAGVYSGCVICSSSATRSRIRNPSYFLMNGGTTTAINAPPASIKRTAKSAEQLIRASPGC